MTLTVVAVNAVAVAEWVGFASALNAGDSTGTYGSLYDFTGAMLLPALLLVLVVNLGSILWVALAAANGGQSPLNRCALLSAVPWAVAVTFVVFRR
ncbi:MAG: hypothetical protein KGI67_12790 [Pseudomonadota bacterium]|nr:hypothetical protein [Pseudomonadota bacterium]